jgi:hypothetical protein
MHQRTEWVIVFFRSRIAAREAEHALRALAKTLPGLKLGNSALVTRTGDNLTS